MLLARDDWYTQRNNSYRPLEACMPTTAVMFWIAAGLKSELLRRCSALGVDINQFDDYAMQQLNTENAKRFAAEKYASLSSQGYAPNEIHGMYHAYLEPLIFGRLVSDFMYVDPGVPGMGMSYDSFVREIQSGRPVWTSGAYDGPHGKIAGHANLFCGVDALGRLRNVDPYGNPHTNYADDTGYDIVYDRSFFTETVKPYGYFKSAHVLRL